MWEGDFNSSSLRLKHQEVPIKLHRYWQGARYFLRSNTQCHIKTSSTIPTKLQFQSSPHSELKTTRRPKP